MDVDEEFASFGPVAALQSIAKCMSAPLFWHDQGREPEGRVLRSGTCCVVDTGVRTIGITACHVYDQFVSDRETLPSLDCQLGTVLFDPVANLIDRDPNLDMATFSLDDVTIGRSGCFAHQPAELWPPSAPSSGSRVMLGGYPGEFRSEDRNSVHHAFVSFFTKVENSSNQSISLSLNITKGRPWPEDTVLVPGTELGGASGGPLVAVREHPTIAWSLAGILYEYQASFEIVLARPVTHINPDGTLSS